MSLAEFRRRIQVSDLSHADQTWFPKWLTGYIDHHRLAERESITLERELVLSFLRSLREKTSPSGDGDVFRSGLRFVAGHGVSGYNCPIALINRWSESTVLRRRQGLP